MWRCVAIQPHSLSLAMKRIAASPRDKHAKSVAPALTSPAATWAADRRTRRPRPSPLTESSCRHLPNKLHYRRPTNEPTYTRAEYVPFIFSSLEWSSIALNRSQEAMSQWPDDGSEHSYRSRCNSAARSIGATSGANVASIIPIHQHRN